MQENLYVIYMSHTENQSLRESLKIHLEKGINFLYSNQLPQGEFPSYCTDINQKQWYPDTSIFSTALISYSLRFMKNRKTSEMINKAKTFLFEEMQPGGLWQYWGSKNHNKLRPDLDDTCCAGEIIKEDSPYIFLENMGTIINNRNKDGIFYTWIKPDKDKDNDTDSVVNANVLFYLGEFEGSQIIIEYLYNIIENDMEERSYWFYLSPSSLYYMITRAYANGVTGLIICSDIIKKKITENHLKNLSSCNELEIAMDVCSLLNLGENNLSLLKPAIDYLTEKQEYSGSWKRISFAVGPPPPLPKTAWFGSEMVTTALSIEALGRIGNLIT